jgi:histidinol dehydrogenase
MATQELDARRVRAAKNQSLFREVNERIEDVRHTTGGIRTNASLFEHVRQTERIDFACECANDACTEQVSMTVADYESIRADPNRFFVLPGHNIVEVEEIVGEGDGFVVVSKLGAGESVAVQLDPRARRR